MIELPPALSRHNCPGLDGPVYDWGWVLALSLLPGLGLVAVKGALTPLHGLGFEAVWIVYYLIQALILGGVMWAVGRQEGDTGMRSVIPYGQEMPVTSFLLLLVLATTVAIFFRDFFKSDALDGFAASLRGIITFWPPDWSTFPDHNSFSESLSGWQVPVFTWTVTLCVTIASAFQTLYFRGFLLPRMPQIGWWTVAINCALFAMFHMSSPWFWGHFLLYTFIWGVVTHMTRNAWIAVVSHMIFNSYMTFLSVFGA